MLLRLLFLLTATVFHYTTSATSDLSTGSVTVIDIAQNQRQQLFYAGYIQTKAQAETTLNNAFKVGAIVYRNQENQWQLLDRLTVTQNNDRSLYAGIISSGTINEFYVLGLTQYGDDSITLTIKRITTDGDLALLASYPLNTSYSIEQLAEQLRFSTNQQTGQLYIAFQQVLLSCMLNTHQRNNCQDISLPEKAALIKPIADNIYYLTQNNQTIELKHYQSNRSKRLYHFALEDGQQVSDFHSHIESYAIQLQQEKEQEQNKQQLITYRPKSFFDRLNDTLFGATNDSQGDYHYRIADNGRLYRYNTVSNEVIIQSSDDYGDSWQDIYRDKCWISQCAMADLIVGANNVLIIKQSKLVAGASEPSYHYYHWKHNEWQQIAWPAVLE